MLPAALHGEHIRDSSTPISPRGKSSESIDGLPKVLKGIGIPIGLLEAPNSLDPSFDAIDIDVVWTESHYWTVFQMCFVYRPVLGASVSFPQDP